MSIGEKEENYIITFCQSVQNTGNKDKEKKNTSNGKVFALTQAEETRMASSMYFASISMICPKKLYKKDWQYRQWIRTILTFHEESTYCGFWVSTYFGLKGISTVWAQNSRKKNKIFRIGFRIFYAKLGQFPYYTYYLLLV